MKIAFKREWLEYGMLLSVLAILLWLGPGRIWDHRIDHGYPYAFNAADAFHHQSRAEGILRIGHYTYEPMEHIQGEYPEFPGYYPPILSELGAVWASFPGLKSFHTTPGLVFLSTLTSAAVMYFLVRRFNTLVAILSLPLYSYLFLSQIAFTYYTWGHWPAILGQVFLILLAWAVSRMETTGWEIILALALVGLTMCYTAWTLFGAVFLVLYLMMYLMKGKLTKKLLLSMILIGVAVLFLTLRVLIIFINIFIPIVDPFQFQVMTDWRGGGGAPPVGFPGISAILLVGMSILIVVILIQLIKQKGKLVSSVPLLFTILMFVLGFSNYFGFAKRAFFIRLFWPLYLSPFLGLTIYYVGRIILQMNKKRWSTYLATIVTMVVLITIIIAVEKPVGGEGAMNSQLWQAFTWLRDSTPSDSNVWVMYGDVFVGDMLWNLQKPHIYVTTEGYIQALQNLSVHRYYPSVVGTNQFAYWVVPADLSKKNSLIWGWSWNRTGDYLLIRNRDLCSTDYILFIKHSYQPALAQYGLYIADLILEKPWMTVAFQNDYALILNNAKTGDACIEDQKIKQAE